LALSDGGKSLDEWRLGWEDTLRASNKLQTTKWTVDRHAASTMTRPASAADQRDADEFLRDTFDKYKHAKDHELMRNFMVTFDRMAGTDRGALSREFFYLVFEACISGTYKGIRLMIGERGRLIPTNDDNIMDAFRCLGMAMAHAVRHGCRGLPGLSPAVKYYLVRGQGLTFIEDDFPPLSIDDVEDGNLYRLLAKVLVGKCITYYLC